MDIGVLVGVARPLQFVVQCAADGHDVGAGDTADEGVDVAFAHATEAGDGDVEFGCLDKVHFIELRCV